MHAGFNKLTCSSSLFVSIFVFNVPLKFNFKLKKKTILNQSFRSESQDNYLLSLNGQGYCLLFVLCVIST